MLTVPAAKWVTAKLKEIAQASYGMSDSELESNRFRSFRNYVYSQVTIKRLHYTWIAGGESGLSQLVQSWLPLSRHKPAGARTVSAGYQESAMDSGLK